MEPALSLDETEVLRPERLAVIDGAVESQDAEGINALAGCSGLLSADSRSAPTLRSLLSREAGRSSAPATTRGPSSPSCWRARIEAGDLAEGRPNVICLLILIVLVPLAHHFPVLGALVAIVGGVTFCAVRLRPADHLDGVMAVRPSRSEARGTCSPGQPSPLR